MIEAESINPNVVVVFGPRLFDISSLIFRFNKLLLQRNMGSKFRLSVPITPYEHGAYKEKWHGCKTSKEDGT